MSFKVERVKVPSYLYRDVKCDQCNIELKSVSGFCEPDGAWHYLQPEDALMIHLSGGYGMFIDPMTASESDLTIILCKECASTLCQTVPIFDEKIKNL